MLSRRACSASESSSVNVVRVDVMARKSYQQLIADIWLLSTHTVPTSTLWAAASADAAGTKPPFQSAPRRYLRLGEHDLYFKNLLVVLSARTLPPVWHVGQ